MPEYESLLRSAYRAFNARDIEAAVELMHPEVDWPNAWEGGRVIGHAAVRDYWNRQFAVILASPRAASTGSSTAGRRSRDARCVGTVGDRRGDERVESDGGDARAKLRRLFALASSSRDLLKIELAIRDWARRDKNGGQAPQANRQSANGIHVRAVRSLLPRREANASVVGEARPGQLSALGARAVPRRQRRRACASPVLPQCARSSSAQDAEPVGG
jgi:SnoaL-like protein